MKKVGCIYPRSVLVHAAAGARVSEAIKDAVSFAVENEVNTKLVFNGCEIDIDHQRIVNQYLEIYDNYEKMEDSCK